MFKDAGGDVVERGAPGCDVSLEESYQGTPDQLSPCERG